MKAAPGSPRPDRGQATVEFAVVIPLVMMLTFGVIEVALVVRDQAAIELAAREGARAASVAANPAGAGGRAARAATGLTPLDVTTTVNTHTVTVAVTYRHRSSLPVIGRAVGPISLSASVTMRLEPP